jgi:hypothetical protein
VLCCRGACKGLPAFGVAKDTARPLCFRVSSSWVTTAQVACLGYDWMGAHPCIHKLVGMPYARLAARQYHDITCKGCLTLAIMFAPFQQHPCRPTWSAMHAWAGHPGQSCMSGTIADNQNMPITECAAVGRCAVNACSHVQFNVIYSSCYLLTVQVHYVLTTASCCPAAAPRKHQPTGRSSTTALSSYSAAP